jgi:hypothetical protein
MKKQRLSPEQGFNAMFVFLDRYYRRTGRKAELGILLGELQMARNGMPFDPAAWEDWLAAINEATVVAQKGGSR